MVDINSLPEYTDAELLKLYRWALTQGVAGQTLSVAGRQISFPMRSELLKTIEWLEGRVNAASGGAGSSTGGFGGNIALVRFGEAQ